MWRGWGDQTRQEVTYEEISSGRKWTLFRSLWIIISCVENIYKYFFSCSHFDVIQRKRFFWWFVNSACEDAHRAGAPQRLNPDTLMFLLFSCENIYSEMRSFYYFTDWSLNISDLWVFPVLVFKKFLFLCGCLQIWLKFHCSCEFNSEMFGFSFTW